MQDPLEGLALVSVGDAATYFGRVSPTTIKRMAGKGQLKIVHVGDRPMVTVESIRAFLAAGGAA